VPFVQVIRRIEGFPADFVGSDGEKGAEKVIEHLLNLGIATLQSSRALRSPQLAVRDLPDIERR
jgi:DNA-binding LacI/PurR family transcriptional regulator